MLGERQIIERQIAALHSPLIKKAQGRHAVLDASRSQLLLVQQVNLIAAYVFSAEMLRGPAKELGELLDCADVTADRIGRVVAPPKVIQHALTESCHRKPPSCDTDVSSST